jgi:hypothetical protein
MFVNTSHWSISKKIVSSEAAWPNGSTLGRKYPWKALDTDCSFRSDPFTNMAAQAILISDWLITKKSSPLKPLSQMDQHLVGSILGKTFIKI